MQAKKIIFKNTALLTSARLLSRIAQFFMFIYAARSLGAHHFGIFAFSQIFTNVLRLFMDFGVSRYSIQQMSRDRERSHIYLGSGIFIKLFLVLFSYIFIYAFSSLLGKDNLTMQVLLILGTGAALDVFTASFSSVFEAHEDMRLPAISILVSNVAMSAIGILVIYYFNNLIFLCLAIISGAFIRMVLFVFLYFYKYKKIFCIFNFYVIKNILKNSYIFYLSSLFLSIYSYIDTVMIDFFVGPESVGYYNASYRLLDIPIFFIESIIVALFPAISRLYSEKSPELFNVVPRLFSIAFTIGVSMACIVIFMSEDIIHIIYGDNYYSSSKVLPVLIASVAFIMPASICNVTVQATDRQHISLFIGIGGALLNIILNFFMIQKYSFVGAAWSTLFTEMAVSLSYLFITKKYIVKNIIQIKYLVKAVILALVVTLCLIATKPLGFAAQLSVFAFIFIPFSLALNIFTIKELKDLL
uniref:flippase n=1 Tax=Candidatus Electronema sp. TaxID=2698783 RepID=UPI004056D40C